MGRVKEILINMQEQSELQGRRFNYMIMDEGYTIEEFNYIQQLNGLKEIKELKEEVLSSNKENE